MLRHDWRRLGISAEEVREFCVWRNAPMRVLSSQGDLVAASWTTWCLQTLQALCGDCHSEKTLRESAQPTSLESRVAPGVMEYARSPKLPRLVFEAQACAAWCAAGATGWPTPPSPCPSCARRTALSPWTACCRTWALWRAAATRGSPA